METKCCFTQPSDPLKAPVFEMKSLGSEGREALGVALAGRSEEVQVGSTSVSAGSQGSSKEFEDCGPDVPGLA